VQVRLEYGRDGLVAEVPDANLAGVLRLTPFPPLSEPAEAVRNALQRPIGTATLRQLAADKRRVCIVICDITRPVPNTLLLPVVLAELHAAGVPSSSITILIATGTHRPNEGAELEALVGAGIARSIRCVNHVCTDTEAQAALGTSPNGVPVRLDREYVDADLRITVGLIEPHFMAGFSGGRKLVMPGIAALETVQAWHSPRFLEHPNAASGVVEGNPVHEEALAIARMCPPDMTIDVTLDENNRITGVFAGDMWEAWSTGVAFARRSVGATVPQPVDIVVTTCAGHPLDATFYQAVKGMVGALPIVKRGGSIIIASQCAEGIGSPHFRELLFGHDDLAEFLRIIQGENWIFVPDQWEVEELARAALHAKIYLVCDGIPSEEAENIFVTPAASVEDALEMAFAEHGRNASVAVIPKGPYVIASVAA
jgi:nickel-dependent lactate racemase